MSTLSPQDDDDSSSSPPTNSQSEPPTSNTTPSDNSETPKLKTRSFAAKKAPMKRSFSARRSGGYNSLSLGRRPLKHWDGLAQIAAQKQAAKKAAAAEAKLQASKRSDSDSDSSEEDEEDASTKPTKETPLLEDNPTVKKLGLETSNLQNFGSKKPMRPLKRAWSRGRGGRSRTEPNKALQEALEAARRLPKTSKLGGDSSSSSTSSSPASSSNQDSNDPSSQSEPESSSSSNDSTDSDDSSSIILPDDDDTIFTETEDDDDLEGLEIPSTKVFETGPKLDHSNLDITPPKNSPPGNINILALDEDVSSDTVKQLLRARRKKMVELSYKFCDEGINDIRLEIAEISSYAEEPEFVQAQILFQKRWSNFYSSLYPDEAATLGNTDMPSSSIYPEPNWWHKWAQDIGTPKKNDIHVNFLTSLVSEFESSPSSSKEQFNAIMLFRYCIMGTPYYSPQAASSAIKTSDIDSLAAIGIGLAVSPNFKSKIEKSVEHQMKRSQSVSLLCGDSSISCLVPLVQCIQLRIEKLESHAQSILNNNPLQFDDYLHYYGVNSDPFLRYCFDILFHIIIWNRSSPQFKQTLKTPLEPSNENSYLLFMLMKWCRFLLTAGGKTYPVKKLYLCTWKVMDITLGSMSQLEAQTKDLLEKSGGSTSRVPDHIEKRFKSYAPFTNARISDLYIDSMTPKIEHLVGDVGSRKLIRQTETGLAPIEEFKSKFQVGGVKVSSSQSNQPEEDIPKTTLPRCGLEGSLILKNVITEPPALMRLKKHIARLSAEKRGLFSDSSDKSSSVPTTITSQFIASNAQEATNEFIKFLKKNDFSNDDYNDDSSYGGAFGFGSSGKKSHLSFGKFSRSPVSDPPLQQTRVEKIFNKIGGDNYQLRSELLDFPIGLGFPRHLLKPEEKSIIENLYQYYLQDFGPLTVVLLTSIAKAYDPKFKAQNRHNVDIFCGIDMPFQVAKPSKKKKKRKLFAFFPCSKPANGIEYETQTLKKYFPRFGNGILEQQLRETDKERHIDILAKAGTAFYLLLLKHLRFNHLMQFHYLAYLVDHNRGCEIFVKTLRHIKPGSLSTGLHEAHGVGYLGIPITEEKKQFENHRMLFFLRCLSNLFYLISANHPGRLKEIATTSPRSLEYLNSFGEIRHKETALYFLYILKHLMTHCSSGWRTNNFKIVTPIYRHVPLEIGSNWLKTSGGFDTEAILSISQDIEKSVGDFNKRHYTDWANHITQFDPHKSLERASSLGYVAETLLDKASLASSPDDIQKLIQVLLEEEEEGQGQGQNLEQDQQQNSSKKAKFSLEQGWIVFSEAAKQPFIQKNPKNIQGPMRSVKDLILLSVPDRHLLPDSELDEQPFQLDELISKTSSNDKVDSFLDSSIGVSWSERVGTNTDSLTLRSSSIRSGGAFDPFS